MSSSFIVVTSAVILLLCMERKRLKQMPKRDKSAFFSLLAIGWFMSFFDLSHMAGPSKLLQMLYKPLMKILE